MKTKTTSFVVFVLFSLLSLSLIASASASIFSKSSSNDQALQSNRIYFHVLDISAIKELTNKNSGKGSQATPWETAIEEATIGLAVVLGREGLELEDFRQAAEDHPGAERLVIHREGGTVSIRPREAPSNVMKGVVDSENREIIDRLRAVLPPELANDPLLKYQVPSNHSGIRIGLDSLSTARLREILNRVDERQSPADTQRTSVADRKKALEALEKNNKNSNPFISPDQHTKNQKEYEKYRRPSGTTLNSGGPSDPPSFNGVKNPIVTVQTSSQQTVPLNDPISEPVTHLVQTSPSQEEEQLHPIITLEHYSPIFSLPSSSPQNVPPAPPHIIPSQIPTTQTTRSNEEHLSPIEQALHRAAARTHDDLPKYYREADQLWLQVPDEWNRRILTKEEEQKKQQR